MKYAKNLSIINNLYMKKYLFLFLLSISAFFYIQSLNAVPENQNEVIQYNPSDYDPWIPIDWIKEDWTFWE